MTRLSQRELRILAVGGVALGLLAFLPMATTGFYLSLGVNIAMYTVLCTAWTLFSGPTHYISLATAAFFGVGTFTVALGIGVLPFPVLVLLGAGLGSLLAGLVGVATLRLSGVYFVIFTLGLAELLRQLVTWLQSRVRLGAGPLCPHRSARAAHLLDAARPCRHCLHRRAGLSTAPGLVLP